MKPPSIIYTLATLALPFFITSPCYAETALVDKEKLNALITKKVTKKKKNQELTRSLFKNRSGTAKTTKTIKGVTLFRGGISPWSKKQKTSEHRIKAKNTPSSFEKSQPMTRPKKPEQTSPHSTVLTKLIEVEKEVMIGDPVDFPIAFHRGSFQINVNDMNSLNNLSTITQVLKENKDVKIVLLGQTCDIGSSNANDILSINRAKAVCEALIARGVDHKSLDFFGQGERKFPKKYTNLEDNTENEKIRQQYRKVTLYRTLK